MNTSTRVCTNLTEASGPNEGHKCIQILQAVCSSRQHDMDEHGFSKKGILEGQHKTPNESSGFMTIGASSSSCGI